jgi:putative tryptophan/tyrosine transport system substrate-binding protein
MRRRSFIKFAGSVVSGWPLVAPAQQPAKIYRIATLSLVKRSSQPVLIQALAAHGYAEGRNTFILERSAEGEPERLPALVAEVIGFQPDVIIAGGWQAADALRKATTTIPIVLWEAVDASRAWIGHQCRPSRRQHHRSNRAIDRINWQTTSNCSRRPCRLQLA